MTSKVAQLALHVKLVHVELLEGGVLTTRHRGAGNRLRRTLARGVKFDQLVMRLSAVLQARAAGTHCTRSRKTLRVAQLPERTSEVLQARAAGTECMQRLAAFIPAPLAMRTSAPPPVATRAEPTGNLPDHAADIRRAEAECSAG
jgi:hypothetical protein